MKRPRRAAVLLLCSAIASEATAQGARGPSGFALDVLDPTPVGDRFFAVPEGRVRGLMDGYAGLHASWAARPLRTAGAGPEYVRSSIAGHFDLTLALAELALLNVDVPAVVAQSGDTGFREEPGGGMGDVRLALRVNLLERPRHRLAAGVQMELWLPTGDETDLAGDSGVRASPKLSLSGRGESFAWALGVGALFRGEHEVGDAQIGGALTFGGAFALLLLDDGVQLGPELHGYTVVAGPSASPFDSTSTPVEALLGAKIRARSFVLGLASGPGLTAAPGAAAFRAVAGVEIVPDERVLDRDGDGLRDRFDACPGDPGAAADGCPPADRDGDTIVDADDACPSDAGLVHVDPKKHGCPQR